MRVSKSITLDLDTLDKVILFMKDTGSNNFSKSFCLLVKLGYAQVTKQKNNINNNITSDSTTTTTVQKK